MVRKRVSNVLRALLSVLFVTAACVEDRQPPTRDLVPLNLDFSRPSLVDPESPWGWWLQPMVWVGVEARLGHDGTGLRLQRLDNGPTAQAVYDLNALFDVAGDRVEGRLAIRRRYNRLQS